MGSNWGRHQPISPRALRWLTVALVIVAIAGVWLAAPELLCAEAREVCEAGGDE